MELVVVAIGLVVLLVGRNLFWLVVGLVGFLLGVGLGELWFVDQPTWLIAMAALLLGVLGAVVALVFERFAIALAGFYAAGYIALAVAGQLGYESVSVFVPLGAGLIGALVTALLTDWAIIVLTALVGSAAVVSAFDLGARLEALAFVALALTGGLVQYAIRGRHRRHRAGMKT